MNESFNLNDGRRVAEESGVFAWPIVLVVSIFLLVFASVLLRSKPTAAASVVPSVAQTTHVKAALTICNTSMQSCIGGYAKFRPDGKRKHLIVRLDLPDHGNPDVLGYAGAAMAYRMDPNYANQFEWIVLRDDPDWREKAIEFDQQFFWQPG